ncbi:hypothetical protein [Paenibacillus sp. UNC499MF]|uniref:hypothetical protein n=1 Tax=Paenibacillus sp. UNC499MF TaxID=1502751 RepID=UPI00089FE952|nr:hypothetical protein [Paenibacillus sp. UNC499MF]SEG70550.1 hypothetical protein SAMN02799616_04408 [Paenibacillus sp. UNC499MF]
MNKQIHTHLLSFLFFSFLGAVFLGDILNFITFLLNVNIAFNFVVLSPVFMIGIVWLFKRFFSMEPFLYAHSDLIFMGVLIAFTFLALPFPDYGGDTVNFHLPMQDLRFMDNINENFLPSSYVTFFPFFPDGLYKVFRSLFGYRAGTLLNTLLIVVIFYQLKGILKAALHQHKLNVALLSLLAAFLVSTEFILANIGVYMIDLIAIPILLEQLKLLTNGKSYSRNTSYYFAALFGFCVALKLTFAIFSFVLLFIYVIKHIRNITLKQFGISVLLACIPCIPYFLYTYLNTGNPLFPFYNQIFKSEYFYMDSNFKDDRWGPHSFLQILFWPVYMYFHPEILSEKAAYTGRISLGFMAAIFLLIVELVRFKKPRKLSELFLSILFICCLYIWTISTGYIRYGLYLEVLSGILIVTVIFKCVHSKKIASNMLGYIFAILLIGQVLSSYHLILAKDFNLGDKPSFRTSKQALKNNFSLIFNDRVDKDTVQDVEAWVLTGPSGYAISLKPNIPTINLQFEWWKATANEAIVSKTNEFFAKNQSKKIYTVYNPHNGNLTEIVKKLSQYNLRITGSKPIKHPYLLEGQIIYLMRIEQSNGVPHNEGNLVKDGSFESVLEKTSWESQNLRKSAIVQEDAQDGKIYVRAAAETPIMQRVKVEALKIYKLSFYSRTEVLNNSATRLQINWFNDSNQLVSTSIKLVQSTPQWNNYEMYEVAPEGATNGVVMINSHEKYNIEFDNVVMNEY